MAIYRATKTEQLIEDSIAKDQGSKYREWLGKVIPTISDAYDPKNGTRSHLGFSTIGDPCSRKLFFNFRWVKQSKHSGRLIRLFNRGHLEEGRFIAMLLTAGFQVYQQDEHGNQFRVSDCGGHFGSAIDGVVIGCPDMPDPNTAILTEMKTHGEKSFKKLIADGVKESKPTHYVQMQTYMRKMALPVALYLAVNKNTDEIYAELIPLDSAVADQFIDRGIRIVLADTPPVGLSEKGRSWFECRYCDYVNHCYNGEMPAVNCRTCIYSQAKEDGTWFCRNEVVKSTLSKEEQLVGCSHYEVARYYGN